MTVARQNRVSSRRGRLRRTAALALGLAGFGLSAAIAATTERVVTDRYSGLAIGGIDPVSYFADGGPRAGVADLEVTAGGAVWRFRNEGNRAAFLAHPEVYQPRFGGYDPVGMADGKPVAGLPSLWLKVGERLYLFARDDTRAAFAADPGRYLAAADRQWPGLRDSLVQ
ncbi:MAG: YHS domain-containing (seleno)protein [Xanthobacteraceae bacterium]